MNLVQAAVILVAVALAVFVIVGRQSHGARAGKKIAFVLLAIGMIITVLIPDATTTVANLVGISRGADLLLYGTVLCFVLYALNDYVRAQREQDTVIRLARRVALLDATQRWATELASRPPTQTALQIDDAEQADPDGQHQPQYPTDTVSAKPKPTPRADK